MSTVNLIWATPEAEKTIAYIARVSNPANQNNDATAPKLLKYLMKHKHWSPFEMVNVCMEITTDRATARQILRHRSFSFQEFSQRYAEVVGHIPYSKPRLQDEKNRQNSIEVEKDIDPYLHQWWEGAQKRVETEAGFLYNEALKKGIAKEVARALLPEGLTESKLYVNGSLRSWLHYVDVRTDESTQKEHREVAQMCKGVLCELFPSLFSGE